MKSLKCEVAPWASTQRGDRFNAKDLPFDPGELGAGARDSSAMLHSHPIQLANILAAEVLKQIPAHQPVAESHENSLFHLLAAQFSSDPWSEEPRQVILRRNVGIQSTPRPLR